MKLVGRIPVEPLDDERLTNIERRIVAGAADAAARPVAHESRMPLALAFAFAVVAVLVLGAGVIGYKLRGDGAQDVVAEAAPIRVNTDAAHSTIDIGDARITGDAATVYTVTRPGGGVLVAMTRGRVELEVDKRGNRPPLVVRAGDTDVEVIGTKFSVDYGDGSGDVDVRVSEGVVRVVHQQQETRVAAGHAWTTRAGLVAIAEAPAKPELATIGKPGSHTDAIEIDMGKAPDVGLHDRVARIPDARVPANATGSAAPQVTRRKDPPARTLDMPGDASSDLKKMIRSQPVAPALDVGTSDAAAAIAKYRSIIVEKRGDEASAALYSIAYVQYMKLGRESDALATLEQYAKRFHGGKEYLPALWLRVRITCLRAKIESDCRRAAYTYVEAAGVANDQGQLADRLKTQP